MLRFALFLGLFAALLAALSIYRSRLGARRFAAAVALLCAVFIGAFVYSALDNSAAARTEELIAAFARGQNLRCDGGAGGAGGGAADGAGGAVINNKTHNFYRSTMTFMHKSTNAKTPLAACSLGE